MKVLRFFVATGLLVCAASADVKKSSRNLQPLTPPRPGSESAGTQSGQTGIGVAAPKKEAPAETATRVSFLGPSTGWGFIKETSSYYAPDGRRLGTLPGGTLFKYDSVKSSSKNTMLVSTVKRGEAWEGPVLLDCTDIAGYEGSPDTISPELLGQLAAYFTLNGKVDDRKAELSKAALAANPNHDAAEQAQKAYQASIVKATDLEAQMNAATGTRREKLMDELRSLKYEQSQLKAKAAQAAAASKTWEDANAPAPAKLAADPQLQALLKEREAARQPVAQLLPAP
ncbi:MAG: hypothetical protein LBW77_00205 [Verrucomicrobiota bacterium]|jgi:hypothetical protein|nr:hypothetical protein [Verrucomicrobiota bacterium]